jgi:hypothetical protein
MYPEISSAGPDRCPKCGMKLVRQNSWGSRRERELSQTRRHRHGKSSIFATPRADHHARHCRFYFRSSILPASAQACVAGVGATHIHPSWRSFAGIPLQAFPPDRYEITFSDVPIGTRVSFRVNDQNSCDENATGAVTRNVFANDVRLVQNTTTPGNGDEPGYGLTVAANGTISQ